VSCRSQPPKTSESMNDFLLLMQQRNIPFVVVGGIALLQHVPGRNTEDLDIILAAPRLAEIPELEVTERNEMFAKASFHGLRVDLRFCEHPLLQPAPWRRSGRRLKRVNAFTLRPQPDGDTGDV